MKSPRLLFYAADPNLRSDVTGCLADYSWRAVTAAGLSGWADGIDNC